MLYGKYESMCCGTIMGSRICPVIPELPDAEAAGLELCI